VKATKATTRLDNSSEDEDRSGPNDDEPQAGGSTLTGNRMLVSSTIVRWARTLVGSSRPIAIAGAPKQPFRDLPTPRHTAS